MTFTVATSVKRHTHTELPFAAPGTGGGRVRGDGGRRGPRWRSHTFGDGVHMITLTGRLEQQAAGRLRTRLAELLQRGCRRLIVDARGAGVPDAREQRLLAELLEDAHRPSCKVAVVLPCRSAVEDALPTGIAVVRTLDDARRLLALDRSRPGDRDRLAPGRGISEADRHALALRQSLRWAAAAAAEGDYETALTWLTTVDYALPAVEPG